MHTFLIQKQKNVVCCDLFNGTAHFLEWGKARLITLIRKVATIFPLFLSLLMTRQVISWYLHSVILRFRCKYVPISHQLLSSLNSNKRLKASDRSAVEIYAERICRRSSFSLVFFFLFLDKLDGWLNCASRTVLLIVNVSLSMIQKKKEERKKRQRERGRELCSALG